MTAFDRHCVEIVAQAGLFADQVEAADVGTPVPSCPGWNVSQLTRHVDGGLRWACEIVTTRAATPPPDAALRDLSAAADDPAELAASLRAAGTDLAAALRAAGPDAAMWCPVAGGGSAFYARRFTHETAMHRVDASLALGGDVVLPVFVAVDGVEEWLDLISQPFHFEVHPWMRDLLGTGRAIGLHATDVDDHWVLDLTGEAIGWRRADEPVAADLRGPITDLLLALYRRRPVSTLAVGGDAGLIDFWLQRVAFG